MQQFAFLRAFSARLVLAGLLPVAVALALLPGASPARAQGYPEVAYSGYADWQGYGQDACVARAQQAMELVRQSFGLVDRRQANAPGITVALDTGDTLAMVHCLGDVETYQRRSLVVIGVHTSRLGMDPQILAVLQECMFGTRCAGVAQGGQGTLPQQGWTAPGGQGMPPQQAWSGQAGQGVPPPGPPASASLPWPRPVGAPVVGGQSPPSFGQPLPGTPASGQTPPAALGQPIPATAAVGSATGCPPANVLLPLQLWWNAATEDAMLVALPSSIAEARAAGYTYIRDEGYISSDRRYGTSAMNRYWHAGRGDSFTTAGPTGNQAARQAGYAAVSTEGWVWPEPRCGSVPLVNWWSEQRGDNFSSATAQGEREAIAAGYGRAWTDSFVFPVGGQVAGGPAGGSQPAGTPPPATTAAGQCPPSTALVPLHSWWSDANGDSALIAGANAAGPPGYRFVRVEGYGYGQQYPGTVPLVRYHHAGRGDYYTAANPTGHEAARIAGYAQVGTEAYILDGERCGAVPLTNWWSEQRQDNLVAASAQSTGDARGAGYGEAWIEGYVMAADGQGAAAPVAPAAPAAVSLDPLAQRFAAAHGRLQTAAFADLYADMSVLLGTYGKTVGWVEGYDANAPQGPGGPDTGRANLDRNAHHGYVMGTGGAAAGAYVGARFADLQQKLSPQATADLARRADELLRRFGM